MQLPKPKKKKSLRKTLVKRVDDAWSLLIRFQDGWTCATCGATNWRNQDKDQIAPGPVIQCGHLFSRDSHSTRWLRENSFAQCKSCNDYHEYNPHPLTLVFLKKYGQEKYEWLGRLYRMTVKFSNAQLLEMAERFEREIKVYMES